MNRPAITTFSQGDNFLWGIRYNENPDCIYYANKRIEVVPGFGCLDEGTSNIIVRDRLVLEVAELVECLPNVYTRVVDIGYRSVSEQKYEEEDDELLGTTYDAYDEFSTKAFFLNSLNNFIKSGHEERCYTKNAWSHEEVNHDNDNWGCIRIDTETIIHFWIAKYGDCDLDVAFNAMNGVYFKRIHRLYREN